MSTILNRYEDPWTAVIYDHQKGQSTEDTNYWKERAGRVALPADLAFWTELAEQCGDPILELGSGTGRLAIPMARAGYRVTGLDVLATMRTAAQEKLDRESEDVRSRLQLVVGDMSNFSLPEHYGLIFSAFHSFNALLTHAQQRGFLESCARHLEPQGRIAINVFNPNLQYLAGPRPEAGHQIEFSCPDGTRVHQTERTEFDLVNQRLLCELTYACTAPDGTVARRAQRLELRYFFRFEMEWMLKACGFEVEAVYGDYEKNPLRPDGGEIILVARRAR